MSYHYAPIMSVVITIVLISAILVHRAKEALMDEPNDRSLHTLPVPRVGGLAIIVGITAGWSVMWSSVVWWIVLPMLLLFAVSLRDDLKGLPIRWRLLAHIIAATMLMIGSGLALQNTLIAFLVLLCVVWMINLFNFMDGSDGLAGGMAILGFSMYGIASLMHDNIQQAMLNFTIGSAALGFINYNFHPAKLFMGDSGSIPLGFLAAAMGLWGWQLEMWPAWFPVLVFSPFILDASVTLTKRLLRRKKIWEAHRSHYYQRIILMGWGHDKLAWYSYALTLTIGISALFGLYLSSNALWLLFLFWGSVYAALMFVVDKRWNNFQSGKDAL
ncbi:MAG: glycosyltransferase family 4 protein [Candidatus Nitrotoga sp.]